MRRGATMAVALLFVVCVFTSASSGSGPPTTHFGVADDAGKYANDAGASFFAQISAVGFTENRMTVTWDAAHPQTISEQAFLDRSIAAADLGGVNIVLAVRPARANGIGNSVGRAQQFAAFVALLARRYPQVRTFVIGNEPNQPRFWQPQYTKGRAVAAAGYERALAASYDALKAVDPTLTVVGGVLSSRGNDNPSAASNSSRSPLWFIHDLGVAYRASKRAKPIMDEFGFHPYPRSNRDGLSLGLQWPDAGFPNLGLVKQALWDAFDGTAQPTVESGLRISIDEVGWQTAIPATSATAYTGVETVPVTSDTAQAAVYGQLIHRAECDPSISDLMFMPFVDETQLTGFQSGLVRADGTDRPSYATVQTALLAGDSCTGRPTSWRHSVTVLGARAMFRYQSHWKYQRSWSFTVQTGEDATYQASIIPVAGRTVLSARQALAVHPLSTTNGYAKANWTPLVRFPSQTLAPGRYAYVIQLRAALAPARTRTFVSKVFLVR